MKKHTPGPWRYVKTHPMSGDAWFVITDADGYGPITDVGGKDIAGQIAEMKYLVTDPEIIEANAALIAQAPRMAEKLEAQAALIEKLGEALKFTWSSRCVDAAGRPFADCGHSACSALDAYVQWQKEQGKK